MWILYVVIAASTYAASISIYNGTTGSGIGSMILIAAFIVSLYIGYSYTPRGEMIKQINKSLDEKYKEHKNDIFSKNSFNALIISLTWLLYLLNRRISQFSEFYVEHGYKNTSLHQALIVLCIGVIVLSAFIIKYNSLSRSEKREIEYWDSEIDKVYKTAIQKYQTEKRKNPKLKSITYVAGHHLIQRKNLLCDLRVFGDTVFIETAYEKQRLAKIFIPNIENIAFEAVEETNNSGISDFATQTIYIMYIEYKTTEKKKYTMKFKIGRKKAVAFENRIIEIKKERESSLNENTKEENEQIIIECSVEERLRRLKNLHQNQLITEEDYEKRKNEILKEV